MGVHEFTAKPKWRLISGGGRRLRPNARAGTSAFAFAFAFAVAFAFGLDAGQRFVFNSSAEWPVNAEPAPYRSPPSRSGRWLVPTEPARK